MNPEPQTNRSLALLVIGLILLVLAFHLGLALKGHGSFRDQHLGVALHYAATQIDLQHTVIPGFNANETPTIQELPLWQAAVGLVFKTMGTWWGWGNLVSLALFLPCLYPLFRLARQFYGERAAWWTLVLFLCQGLVFAYAGQAGTDGFSLAITIWFWFACVRLLDQPARWFVPAVLLGVLSATAKLPFFMTAGLGAFFLLLHTCGWHWRKLAVLAGAGGAAGIIFLAWNHYIEQLQAGAEFPYVDLRLKGRTGDMTMMYWYFGDLHYRLNPANWIRGGWRFVNYVFGSFTLVAVFAGALLSRRIHPAAKFFLAGAILTTLVFTHLVLHHAHYYLMYTPAVALLMAAAVARAESFLQSQGFRPALVTGVTAALLLAGLLQGLISFKALSYDAFPEKMAEIIRRHTDPSDKLMLVNGGWGGEELMRTGRTGLSIWGPDLFDDPAKYARLKQLGYNRLVILSESPYQNAIQIVNPGQTGIPRILARDHLTATVEKWPTVVATDDIIIKEIP
jgi:hypothetical protein